MIMKPESIVGIYKDVQYTIVLSKAHTRLSTRAMNLHREQIEDACEF